MADKYLSAYYDGNNGNKIYLELHVYTVATSIANNTTTERADLYAVVNDASYQWYNNYGSEAFIGINGNNTTQTVNFDYRTTGTKALISTWDTVVQHDNNGAASIGISAHHYSGVGLGNASVSGTYTCDTIPRYATSNQSLNNRTETTITMNWSSDNTIDYIWYSTNNGSTWTGVDVTDATSGSYTIYNLSANTTYNIKTRVRRKDSQLTTDSSTLAVKTYSYPAQTIASKTETSITVNWSADSIVDAVHYSLDNGANWGNYIAANSTSGTYTITGLSANGTYNVKTRVKRKDTQTYSDTNVSTVTTYYFPHCVGSPNFTIGDVIKLDFYNPLNRTIIVKILGNNNSEIGWWQGNGTTISGFNDNVSKTLQYNSIPNSQSGYYKVQVEYGDHIEIRDVGNTYTINRNECIPTFSSFDIQDINPNTLDLTGNNQIIVKSFSNVQIDIPVAKKAVAKNGASIVRYVAVSGNKTIAIDYSDTNAVSGVINNVENIDVVVYAVDSRGLSSQLVQKLFDFKDYKNPTIINSNVYRENGVGTKVLFELSGNYWNESFGAISNTIDKICFTYKKITDTSYPEWIDITNYFTIENGTYNNNSEAFLPTIDNGTTAIEFEVGVEYNTVFWVQDKTSSMNNIIMSNFLTLNSGIPCTSKQKNSDGKYSIGVNKLPNENCAFSIDGGLEVDGEGHTNGIVVSKDKPTKNEKIWVQRSKNLIHPIENSNHDYGGVVVTTYKDRIHFEGTSTTGLIYHIPINNIELDGTYTLSITPIGTVGMNYMSMSLDDINQQRISVETSFMGGQQYSITFNASMIAGYLFFYCNGGVTINFDAYIQLEPGSVANTYEEYVDNKISLKNQIGEYEDFVNIDKLKNKIQKNVLVHGYENYTYDVLAGDSTQWTVLHEVAFESTGGLVQINYISSICNINSLFDLKVYVEIDGINYGYIMETNTTTVESKTGMLAVKLNPGRHILKIVVYNANGVYQFKKIPAFTGCTLIITEV